MIKRIEPNDKPKIPVKDFELKQKPNIIDKNLSPEQLKQYSNIMSKYQRQAEKELKKLDVEQAAEDRKQENEALKALEEITEEDLKIFSKQPSFQEAFLKTLPEEWQKQIQKTIGEKNEQK